MGKNILHILTINSIIALVIGIISFNRENWWSPFLMAFVFSQGIGLSIYALIHFFSPLLASLSKLFRSLFLVALFLAGTVAGVQTGVWFFGLFFGIQIDFWQQSSLLPTFGLSIIFGTLGYLYFSMKESAEAMAKDLREKELAEEKLKRLKTKAELEALQSKINPHFLFNTLNSIASLISDNPKKAESTVEKLSEIFRSTLFSSQRELVPLSEELKIVRDYLEIEQLRLGDRLSFEITCDPGLAEAMMIPGLTIQPLAENSVRHGISPLPEGGRITIRIRKTDRRCEIDVSDNGIGFAGTAEGSGHGLSSVRERLKLTYGDQGQFEVRRDNGTHILISLPLVHD